MALSATIYHWQVTLSDVDRGVYEELDLRLARHPSESMRYLVTRALAYCLSYEPGISFSKGGVSSGEAPLSIVDPTGRLLSWIEIGTPSAERLHKASKATDRVALYSSEKIGLLQREAQSSHVHKLDRIAVFLIEPSLIAALESLLGRNARFELVRSDERLYFTSDTDTLEGAIVRVSLDAPAEQP